MKKIRMALFAALTVSSATVFAYDITLTNNLDAPVLVTISRVACDSIGNIRLEKGQTRVIDVKLCCLPAIHKAAFMIKPQGGQFKGKTAGVVLQIPNVNMTAFGKELSRQYGGVMSCKSLSLNIDSSFFSRPAPGRSDLYIHNVDLKLK